MSPGHFYSDIGYVEWPTSSNIRPFEMVEDDGLKNRTVEAMFDQWSVEIGASSASDVMRYVRSSFTMGGDVLFVMSSDSEFVGCIAVDRKQFHPFISNLLVSVEHRKRGHAKTLVAFAESFVRDRLMYDAVRLWCGPDMIHFYRSIGYAVDSEKSNSAIVIMIKKFQSDDTQSTTTLGDSSCSSEFCLL